MKNTYFQGKHPNFGDGLNLWLWPRLLPNFFDDDESKLFIGIGSIIGNHYPSKAKKIVFGSGFVPEYMEQPDVSGPDWDIFFVRGPRTAKRLNISERLAVGDSAILIRSLIDVKQKEGAEHISFMPHWASLDIGNWEEACRLAGVKMIDPRWSVDRVIEGLVNSRLVITEAMHGAIVADALRIPWIPILPIHSFHRAKWFDWAEALNIDLHPYRLWPSTLDETDHALTHRPFLSAIKRNISGVPMLATMTNKTILHMAAYRIGRLAQVSPSLSPDKSIDRALCIMLDKLKSLQAAYNLPI